MHRFSIPAVKTIASRNGNVEMPRWIRVFFLPLVYGVDTLEQRFLRSRDALGWGEVSRATEIIIRLKGSICPIFRYDQSLLYLFVRGYAEVELLRRKSSMDGKYHFLCQRSMGKSAQMWLPNTLPRAQKDYWDVQ